MLAARFLLLLLVLPVPLLAAPPDSVPSKSESLPVAELPPIPVVLLAPQATGAAPRALRYHLLPLRRDLQPGNAAPLWIRASQAAREITKKPNEDWLSRGTMALEKLPKKEIREALAPYEMALRIAEQASLRESCDWAVPPFTLVNWDFPFSEIQGCRELARLLVVRSRLEMSEGDYDKAALSLRTGLALARHLGDSDTMIHGLVGIAISAVMLNVVEEWMQVPGSPNLYWSLTALPVPIIDVRRSIEYELNNLDRILPELQSLRKGGAEPVQVEALVAKLARFMSMMNGRPNAEPDWQIRIGIAAVVAKHYPDARRSLLAEGHKAERLDALSPIQVFVIYQMEQYDRTRDEILKALTLPPWQAQSSMEAVTKEMYRLRAELSNPLITMLFPAIQKVYEARTRVERIVAGLRCGEALRLYAATHDGKAPAKFADITAVPLPIDPTTGKGFDGFYKATDGRGVLEVPSMMPGTPQLGRRFEICTAR